MGIVQWLRATQRATERSTKKSPKPEGLRLDLITIYLLFLFPLDIEDIDATIITINSDRRICGNS